MEVVLLVVDLLGIAMVAVARMKRRRHDGVRRLAARTAAPVAAWSPPDEDGWDDDLGWEGGAESPSREAWERWRATESPLAAAAPEPEPELPAVERWRAAASAEEWDDDLGWEGEEQPETPPVTPTEAPVTRTWSRNGHPPTATTPAVPAKRAAVTEPARDWFDAEEPPAAG